MDNFRRSLFLVLVATLPGLAQATNGYLSHGYGTKSKAMAGAGTALALDALSPLTNPAASVRYDDRFDLGISAFIPERGFTANDDAAEPPNPSIPPGEYESGQDVFYIPHFGISKKLDEQQAIGFTLAANGGLNTDYGEAVFQNFGPPPPGPFSATGQTLADFAQLGLGFTYARKLNKQHSIGITPVFAVQRVRIEGLQPFRSVSVRPGNVTDRGYDYSYGGGVRIGWQGWFMDDTVKLGASYQSRLWMTRFDKYDGLFAERGDFDTPPSYNVGIAFSPTKKLTVALDVQRILYDDIDSLGNRNDQAIMPGTPVLGNDDGIGFGWRDITIGKLGVSYDATDKLTLRAGYSKSEQVIPSTQALFNILAPATVTEHITGGFTHQIGKDSEINFSFLYAPREKVSGTNPNTGPQTGFLELEQYEAEISWGRRF